MDKRVPLSTGTILNFPGMPCAIEELCGKGSNALVYRATYEDPLTHGVLHDVLIKELFPFHLGNAIYRDAGNRIRVLPDGEDTFALHRRSFEQGNEMHLKLLRMHPDSNGGNIITFPYNGTYYTLLPLNGGRELYSYAAQKPTLRRITLWMLGILEALTTFHKSGYLHLDIAPDNVILIPRGEREDVLLIDYNSVCPLEQWQAGGSIASSLKDGFTALEIQTSEYSLVSYATDLYSVAAVFFYCLMGRRLQLEEIAASRMPDIMESAGLKNVPDTVISMIRRILSKGLSSIPRRRYQDTDSMRKDFQELINRIDCVGVTPWAILEKERTRMNDLIRQNPFLDYLKNESRQYPIRIQFENELCDLKSFSDRICQKDRQPVLLQAEGGMGKTTALQLCALRQNARYSPQEPVAVYISASNYRPNQNWFIYDSILEMLRFHPNTGSFQDARHELELLLGKPLQTRNGSKPVLLILVDGLNEISCDASLLMRELAQIARMPGVAVVLSSRTDFALPDMQTAKLQPLQGVDVEEILRKQGLLTPENENVRRLLQTPLLLSMYVDSAIQGGKQINIETIDALMDCYLEAIERKETLRMPEDASERWQIDAAIRYVLPVIAEATQSGTLKDAELLRSIGKCYRVLRSRSMLRVFPQWIGHRRDIFCGAQSVEEWYGRIVQQLLWKKLGLLVREENGGFRLIHQNIGEWLIEKNKPVQKKIAGRTLVQSLLIGALITVLLAGGGYGVKTMLVEPMKIPYDDSLVENVMDISLLSYRDYGNLWNSVRGMIDAAEAGDLERFDRLYSDYQKNAEDRTQTLLLVNDENQGLIAQIKNSDGEAVSYSGYPLDLDTFQKLAEYYTKRRGVYDANLPVLRYAAEQYARNAGEKAADFIGRFRSMLESDAKLAIFLMQRTCIIYQNENDHLTETERKLLADDPLKETLDDPLEEDDQNSDPEKTGESGIKLTELEDAAKKAENMVLNNYIMIQYTNEREEKQE